MPRMASKEIHKFPTVPHSLDSIVKPEELVDIVEMTPLTLHDRRTYNLLLGNAWNSILQRKKHTISRRELTKHVDSNNQDIATTMRKLMASIVVVKVRNNKNGKPSRRQISLLGSNDIEERGPIEYSFPPELVDIIEKTQIFARIHTEVMFALSSKYSLALYEWIQKRVNMKYVFYETLPIEEVRGMLGVEKDKLKTFGNLNKYAIKPALEEVSFLTEYDVTVEPIKTGRAVTHVKFSWNKKSDIGSQIAAIEEIGRSKVGRKARMENRAVAIEDYVDSQKTNSSSSKVLPMGLSQEVIDKARMMTKEAGTGWDFDAILTEFKEYAAKKGTPNNANGALLKFTERKIAKAP